MQTPLMRAARLALGPGPPHPGQEAHEARPSMVSRNPHPPAPLGGSGRVRGTARRRSGLPRSFYTALGRLTGQLACGYAWRAETLDPAAAVRYLVQA